MSRSLHDRAHDAWVIAEVIDQRLRRDLVVPDGHVYLFGVEAQLTRKHGGPGESVSAFLRLAHPNPWEAAQIAAEFRVFLDRPRAKVWISRGPRGFAKATPLLHGVALDADDYPTLAEQIPATANPVLATALDAGRPPDEHDPGVTLVPDE